MIMKQKILFFLTALFFSLNISAQNTEELGKLYSQREYNKVISLGLEELKNYPNQPTLNMLVGRSYADIKQFEKAIPFLEKGIAKENNLDQVRAWSYVYLGKCYYATDDNQKSKESILACLKLNATENVTKFAQKLLDTYQISDFYNSWENVETKNIRFHFQEPKNIKDKELFMQNRETAYTEINKFFNAKPYKKIDYFVWDNPEQAAKKLGLELGFASPNLCIINSKNNQTRGHEIAHILVAFGIYPTNTTPLINEGIAAYFDQTNRDRIEMAKELLAGKDIDVIDLWENPKNYPSDYNYIIGSALMAFLFEKGTEEQMKSLLKDQTTTSARNIYQNFDNLIIDFIAKIK